MQPTQFIQPLQSEFVQPIKLPIGYDNFREIINQKLYLIDKSLFIKEILDDRETKVVVITRPRRFGKTLNLSMLQHFLAPEVDGFQTKDLFDNLKITQVAHGEYFKTYQGKYPVIFISLKNIKKATFQESIEGFRNLIQELYRTHQHILKSQKLEPNEKNLFKKFLCGKATKVALEDSLKILSELLKKYHNQEPYLLIDEYDTPIQHAYSNKYYNEMIDFIRSLFGAALKGNSNITKAVVTGILRISKESLFSDLNNVNVYSLLDERYSQYFGFTEEEMNSLLVQVNLTEKATEVRDWYNGYRMGQTTVYNPWSIANFVNHRCFKPYWINTSDNQLIRDLLTKSTDNFRLQTEELLKGNSIQQTIDDKMVYGDLLYRNEMAAWSLLLFAGYLKVIEMKKIGVEWVYELNIPNHEVKEFYLKTIQRWLTGDGNPNLYNTILEALLNGNIEKFSEYFAMFIEQTTSYHDYQHDPEAFYHGLLIGLTASLYGNTKYQIISNRESGFGRYDYLIFSHDFTKPTIIFELKRVKKPKATTTDEELETLLNNTATAALNQITAQNYLTEAKKLGATNIIEIGLAFCGKQFAIKSD
jgi:hypothetical protein